MVKTGKFHKSISPERRGDILAGCVIFLYCLVYALTRFFVSPSMELDESEQFLHSSFFRLGYNNQPPLYNWIVKAASSIFSLNLATLLFVKYSLLFLFYFVFYLTVRSFRDSKKALLITGSLVIFPLYSYEFNRDLSHSILVALMSSLTIFLYIRLLMRGKALYYFLIGIAIGSGILSKYNYLIFLLALVLASVTCREGRRLLFDKRTLLAVLGSVIVTLPHFLWLAEKHFAPFGFAFEKSKIGELGSNSFSEVFLVLGKSYLEALAFFLIFALFLYRRMSLNE
jgi:4-amino-4-deoxy-L-arabinose transferase-like glycosyltransferase